MASAALFVLVAPAAATPKTVTGKLSKPGYDVIALAANGEVRSVRATPRFRLRPPAGSATLALRAADGSYAGPVVVGEEKKDERAILGVKAGAKLGKVKVKAAKGFAKPKRNLPRRWMDTKREARSRKGVPIGAGNFGRVRSEAKRGAPGDLDEDGVADPLDIDDDGDLVLDNLDLSPAGGTARAAGRQSANEFGLFSSLMVDVHMTANANPRSATDPGSTAFTDAQIEEVLPSRGDLLLTRVAGDSTELDCGGDADPANPGGWMGGLSYCSRGGTGRAALVRSDPPAESHLPFPDCCDSDSDGFGSLDDPRITSDLGEVTLRHGANSAEIGTGDVLIQQVSNGGVESEFASAIQYVFATTPALVSYDDGQGNDATVPYPVTGPDPGTPGPGTRENPFPVRAAPSGELILRLTFWRPQRRPIPPETGEWIDIGGLAYTAGIADIGAFCPQSAFSEDDPNTAAVEDDPSLTLPQVPINRPDAGGFLDLAGDRPADPANTLTYSVNITHCLAARGLPPWNADETRHLAFSGLAPGTPDGAQQAISFRRE